MIETSGTVVLGGISKKEQIQFLTHKRICSNLKTINLKLSCNQDGIYRVRTKFKKDSGEINPFGVHRNMRVKD